ncbi:MAG TPA: hypothetical protein VFK05_30450 [Polyangiaceae bacterium]|nr:hypothetical protein [Polyangiaceae bacterium]
MGEGAGIAPGGRMLGAGGRALGACGRMLGGSGGRDPLARGGVGGIGDSRFGCAKGGGRRTGGGGGVPGGRVDGASGAPVGLGGKETGRGD